MFADDEDEEEDMVAGGLSESAYDDEEVGVVARRAVTAALSISISTSGCARQGRTTTPVRSSRRARGKDQALRFFIREVSGCMVCLGGACSAYIYNCAGAQCKRCVREQQHTTLHTVVDSI